MRLALLSVQDLEVEYRTLAGAVRAVRGVSFTLEEGESLGVVGESGCGKSTLARALVRVLPRNGRITGGKIVYRGEDLVTVPEGRMRELRWREISVVPQAAMNSLDPVYRVADQFAEVLCHRGGLTRRQALERTRELFRLVGLDEHRIGYYPHEFSGGMKQRAVIALALALNPRLVIADEPVTALDVIVQYQILKELQRLRQKLGLALVLITHDVSVVANMCDRLVVMYAGRVVEAGTVAQVLSSPRHPYTAGLKAAFPDMAGEGGRLEGIPGFPPDLAGEVEPCAFAPRCPSAQDRCREQVPSLVEVAPGHLVRCHLAARGRSGQVG